jgi:hypothetical protein
MGQQIMHQNYFATNRIELLLDVPAGMYILELSAGKEQSIFKVVKK